MQENKETNHDKAPQPAITTHHGSASMGFIYGGGYGKDPDLARHADRIAAALHEKLGLPFTKRGNTDGMSCGAHYDGQYTFGLSASKGRDGTTTFGGYFESDDHSLLEEQTRAKHPAIRAAFQSAFREGPIFASSAQFQDMQAAVDWLLTTGGTYCPSIRTARTAKGKHAEDHQGRKGT